MFLSYEFTIFIGYRASHVVCFTSGESRTFSCFEEVERFVQVAEFTCTQFVVIRLSLSTSMGSVEIFRFISLFWAYPLSFSIAVIAFIGSKNVLLVSLYILHSSAETVFCETFPFDICFQNVLIAHEAFLS